MKIFALVPARGGSKSLKKKNIHPFLGLPLMEHVIQCSKRCKSIEETICSTDDDEIASVAENLGISVHHRSAELARDTSHINDTVKAVLDMKKAEDDDLLVLLQPTSPFTLPEHVETVIDLVKNDPQSTGGETIAEMPPNFHAFNQRELNDDYVRFHFMEERMRLYNKQMKPHFYRIGNVIVTKASTIRTQNNLWGDHCRYHIIEQPYAADIDGPKDWPYGQWLFESGQVKLPWMK